MSKDDAELSADAKASLVVSLSQHEIKLSDGGVYCLSE